MKTSKNATVLLDAVAGLPWAVRPLAHANDDKGLPSPVVLPEAPFRPRPQYPS
jgi:hypothetical protein